MWPYQAVNPAGVPQRTRLRETAKENIGQSNATISAGWTVGHDPIIIIFRKAGREPAEHNVDRLRL